MARIELIHVGKTLRDQPAERRSAAGGAAPGAGTFSLHDLDLTVPDGKTLVVLGPSGCGKTTLLKIIAGLILPDSGRVRYDGVDVRDLRPGQRRLGMVFQNYALYPHMSSRTNVLSYFFFRRKTPELDALARAKYERTAALMGVELTQLLDRRPTTLSGGEKQRVAMGRCITRDAEVFLVDEPFANLDQALRERYRVNLKSLLRQFGITTVYVTHDHNEALVLADLLAVMDRGRIEQVGTYEEIYDQPVNLFVAEFLNPHVGLPPISLVEAGHLPWVAEGANARVGVRPEDVEVTGEAREDAVAGTVTGRVSPPSRHDVHLTIRVGECLVHAQVPGPGPGGGGDRVWLRFRRYHLFDRSSGARLRSVERQPSPR